MFKKRNLWGQKLMLYTEHHVCSMLVLSFLADTKFETVKKMCGFSFHVVWKSVESPGNYVQHLSGMLLLGNQSTNRRFKKALLWPKSQGWWHIVQYMIWEGHGYLRVIFLLFITVSKRSSGNRTRAFSNSSDMGIGMQESEKALTG